MPTNEGDDVSGQRVPVGPDALGGGERQIDPLVPSTAWPLDEHRAWVDGEISMAEKPGTQHTGAASVEAGHLGTEAAAAHDSLAGEPPDKALGTASLLAARVEELWVAVTDGARAAGAQSLGFAGRVLAGIGGVTHEGRLVGPLQPDDITACAEHCRYGGAPDAGRLGFALAAHATAEAAGLQPQVTASNSRPDARIWTAAFLEAVERLRGRSPNAQESLATDDVTLLGLADGLAVCRALERAGESAVGFRTPNGGASASPEPATVWLLQLIGGRAPQGWSGRLRALASDLLDHGARLRARIDDTDPAAVALDIVLRRCWPSAMAEAPHPSHAAQQRLMAALLRESAPPLGALEQAAVRLAALDALVTQTAAALVPATGEVARILRATQGAMKRWVWEDKPGRRGVATARWLIDDEPHVQAFLWAVLAPHFGPHLRDEEYLPGYGLKQPRSDFGVVTLKLIVEVKIARTPSDFRRIEEEVAGDLGLYFSDPARYDRMLVYVYDDSDHAQPQLYEALRTALTQRDARVEDVIVVRRPGMIPDRGSRA